MVLQKPPKQYHFFRFRLCAFTIASSSLILPLLTFSVINCAFTSISSTAASCWTTAAFTSSNSWASSIICRSIFWMASCRPWTARSADCDWPRRLLCRSYMDSIRVCFVQKESIAFTAWLKTWLFEVSSTAALISSSLASGLTIRYCLAICSDNLFRNSLSTCWYSLIALFSFRSTLPTWDLFFGSPDSLCCLIALIRAPKLRYKVIVSDPRASNSRLVCVSWLASGSSIALVWRKRSRSRLRSMEFIPSSMSLHSLSIVLGPLNPGSTRFCISTSLSPILLR